MDISIGLDALLKREIMSSPGIELDSPVIQPEAWSPYSLSHLVHIFAPTFFNLRPSVITAPHSRSSNYKVSGRIFHPILYAILAACTAHRTLLHFSIPTVLVACTSCRVPSYVLGQRFPNTFGHGTLCNLVNV
jgi:hypothetical protein